MDNNKRTVLHDLIKTHDKILRGKTGLSNQTSKYVMQIRSSLLGTIKVVERRDLLNKVVSGPPPS